MELQKANPGGFDALAECRWIYDHLLRELRKDGHDPKIFNMMLYLTAKNNIALIANAMVGKSEINKTICKYINERRQIIGAYRGNVTPHLDEQMKIEAFPKDVLERCSVLLSEGG